MRWIWAILCVLGFCAFASLGAELPSRESRFRSDSNLVLIRATVMDPSDRFVTDLKQSNFRLFDEKDEQKIVSVEIQDAPVSVGIVFDSSGSMKKAKHRAVDALRQFITSADPQDDYCVVQVRDRPEVTLDFTPDAERVLNHLASAPSVGSTALIDAVYLAATYMKKAPHDRRMLLVLSDGDDNNSRYSDKELKAVLEEAGVTVYAIGVGVRPPMLFDTSMNGAALLSEMAEASGGRYFDAAWADDLPDIMQKIDIRYEYVIGFAPPPHKADGRYHRVQLKLVGQQRLRAFWRPGYYAPQPAMEARRKSSRGPRETLLKPEPAGDAAPQR